MRSKKSFLQAVRNAVATAVLCAALIGSFALAAKADTEAVDFTAPYMYWPGSNNYTLGWTFTPVNNITVTCVGWWDDSCNGLLSSHDIAIWDNVGNLLSQATLPSGSGTFAINDFRYVSLPGWLNLTAGQTYVIGGTSGLDAYATNVSNFTTDPNVAFGTMRYEATGGALAFPTQNAPGFDPGIFGPNFLLLQNLGGGGGGGGVPEPGPALTLAGMGVAALVFLRRRNNSA
jgi:hypothetical protein